MTKNDLQIIISDWIQNCLVNWQKNLVCVIHFGSTNKDPLKFETDIDLLLIFEQLPQKKWDKFKFIEPYESLLEEKFKNLSPYSFVPSIITWNKKSFLEFHMLYLDFVDNATLIYDPQGVGKNIINKTQNWLVQVGAKKYQKGNLWYWDVNPDKKKKFKWGY